MRKDLEKVRRLRRGVALALVFAVHRAPQAHKGFLAKGPLEETVRRAIDEIGPPIRMSREVKLVSDGVEASFQLVAWV